MRRLCLALLVALLLVACESDDPTGDPVADSGQSESPAATEDEAEDEGAAEEPREAQEELTDEEPAEDDAPALEGPEAPDFSLELADGSAFELSAEDRATFLVFWAEW